MRSTAGVVSTLTLLRDTSTPSSVMTSNVSTLEPSLPACLSRVWPSSNSSVSTYLVSNGIVVVTFSCFVSRTIVLVPTRTTSS